MDSDEEDYVLYGTPIEREEDVTSRKKKAIAEASGQLRTLPSWKQEVRDEEGRRRFHGAFTGGYSAGYFNTVGSKEGWTPQSFVSSRKNRAEVKQQSILSFLDEDEKEDLEGKSLGASMQFDTFGFTAAELARKQAEMEQQQRPSAIPGPVPDEILLPATESIGIKLLMKMGWRRGRSIKDSHANSVHDARREARRAFLAFSSNDGKAAPSESDPILGDLDIEQPANDEVPSSISKQVHILESKQDLHGLGFDPYKRAPEFREKKRLRISENRGPGYRKALSVKNDIFGFKSGKVAPGFGIGALEELDAEDDDVYASGYDFGETYVQEIDEPSSLSAESKQKFLMKDSKQKLLTKEQGVLPGFRLASNSEYQLERFDPPLVPKDYSPHHKYLGPLETDYKFADNGPPEVPSPNDNSLKLLIDGLATLVARCGKLFEDLSREKNQSNPLFSFLVGGNGHDYYARKLWEARQKRADVTKQHLDGKKFPTMQNISAETRGKILGEKPLERSSKDSSVMLADSVHLQYNLSDTFMKPALFNEIPEITKPFKDDPAKLERFERFLKDKYQGGLRSIEFGGSSNMSEAARAHERLDFEAAAEAMEKGKLGKEGKVPTNPVTEYLTTEGMQFTSGGSERVKNTKAEDLITKKIYPRREEYQWRPSPILCKRFDLIDPYMGKPPPAPRIKSKIDTLIFTPDSVKSKDREETGKTTDDSFHMPQFDAEMISKDGVDKEIEVEVDVENVERPVDLYKAIFSDDSDDEGDTSSLNKAEDPDKMVEAANTTLNRLMAGDFLESLGKELGLEVLPDLAYAKSNTRTPALQKEMVNSSSENAKIHVAENKASSSTFATGEPSLNHGDPHPQEKAGMFNKNEFVRGNSAKDNKPTDTVSLGTKHDKVSSEKVFHDERKVNASLSSNQSFSSSSLSEDQRSRKRSWRRRHKSRSSDFDSDSSSGEQGSHHSRSKGRRKASSSREKSQSSKKHSKHHKHRSRDTRSGSHYSRDRENAEGRREKYKRKS